jgi:tetratricopeptide (TPR) repeat protein
MQDTTIELYARRCGDLPTLRALRRALEQRGHAVELSGVEGLRAECGATLPRGPLSCTLRVVVSEGEPSPRAGSERVAAVLDAALPPLPGSVPPLDVLDADWVLVPGPAHAAWIGGFTRGEVMACGLPRLDDLARDPAGIRERARRELRIGGAAHVVLYAPGAEPGRSAVDTLGDEIARIPAEGAVVLVLGRDGSAEWIESHRELASRSAGIALITDVEWETALAACDAVVSDDASLLYEAAALGRGVVGVGVQPGAAPGWIPGFEIGPWIDGPQELAAAVASILPGSAAASRWAAAADRCRAELFDMTEPAAQRMAEAIDCALAQCGATGEALDRIAGGAKELEEIEALIAFGRLDEARERLRAWLAHRPDARGLRLLAAIHRRQRKPEAALEAASEAERLARGELGRVLCERGRVLADVDRLDEAYGAFENAHYVAEGLAEALVGLGSLALHAGDAAKSERCFREALALEASSRTLAGLGLAQLALGRAREAIEPLERALDLEPDCTSAVYGIVQAGFQTGELRVAERRVSAYVDLHGANLDLAFTLAGLRTELGDRAAAREMIDRIELFDPAYPGLADLRAKLDGQRV